MGLKCEELNGRNLVELLPNNCPINHEFIDIRTSILFRYTHMVFNNANVNTHRLCHVFYCKRQIFWSEVKKNYKIAPTAHTHT